MIRFEQVYKRYKDNEFSLEDLNFEVDPGEFVFLIGPSGSGKTTIIKLLIREEMPTSGSIFFDNFDITRLSRNSVYKLRRQIGVIFQDYKLIPDKNVYENVAFAMEVAGKKDREIRETVPYLLEIVGLADRMKSFPHHLSGGEKQRVAIARAVSNNPRVLIADEPTGNLDPGAAWDIVQILTKINSWGTTVLMSTHGTDIVNTLNKRVIQMEHGEIIRDDNKGFYESTAPDPEEVEQIADTVTQQTGESMGELDPAGKSKKGPITVSLNKQGQAAVAIEGQKNKTDKGGLFGLFGGSRQNNRTDNLTSEKPLSENLAFAEALTDNVETGDEVDAPGRQRTSILKLDIENELTSQLQGAGYIDIEDILAAGVERLAQDLKLEADVLQALAAAITLVDTSSEAEDFASQAKEYGGASVEDDERESKETSEEQADKQEDTSNVQKRADDKSGDDQTSKAQKNKVSENESDTNSDRKKIEIPKTSKKATKVELKIRKK